jgi:hypothetical protein
MEITHNPEKNGLELRFKEKPNKALTDLLGILGFRYSYRQTMWYATKTTQRENFLKHLQETLQQNLDINSIPIEAAYNPSIENINKRHFSLVTITLEDTDSQDRVENYVLFEPSGKIAKKIAEDHFKQAKKVEVFPRNKKKQARILFELGRIIQAPIKEAKTKIEHFQEIDLSKAEETNENNITLPVEEEPSEAILSELYNLKRKEPFSYSELTALGINFSQDAWEVSIGDYKIIRTAIFSLSYKIKKLTPA